MVVYMCFWVIDRLVPRYRDDVLPEFCLAKNYTNNNFFQTYCLPPDINKYLLCCCRSPGADGA